MTKMSFPIDVLNGTETVVSRPIYNSSLLVKFNYLRYRDYLRKYTTPLYANYNHSDNQPCEQCLNNSFSVYK